MNIYDALAKDHRTFEALLDRLVTTSKANDPGWKEVLDQLRRGVIAHAHAEEAVFYNALRETDAAKGIIAHSYVEHATAEGELRTLGLAKLIDQSWTALSERLSKDLRHHIKEEETRVFEAARKVLSDDDAARIGAAFERLKLDTAKDGDSIIASTVDLVANLLPPRLTGSFRKHVNDPRSHA